MKRGLVLLVIILIFISCSSDDDLHQSQKINVPTGSIIAEINGELKTFNIDAKAVIDTIPWNFGQNAVKISISGKITDDDNSENILIWFFTTPEKEIDEGIYPDLNKQIYQYLEYNNKWRGDLYNYGSNRYVDEYYSSGSSIIQIDSLIKGTFSGNVAIGAGATGQEQPPFDYKIRNGQYNLILER